LTITGLAAALALYIASASATDNVDRMIEIAFGRAQREDLTVAFAEPRDPHALYELAQMPGVLRVEPFRVVGATLVAGPRREREALSGGERGGDLSRLVDLRGRVVEPPLRGAILSGRLARQLGVRAGDKITADVSEGDRPQLDLNVASVVETPIGSSARVDRATLNRLMREGASLSGAYLTVDRARLRTIYARLKRTPMVAAVTARETMLEGIRDTVAENMGIVTLFNTGFAALIVLGVVYNSARISLSERARDLASMRVLGFRRSETGFVLLGEQLLLVIASLPVGIVLGIGLSRYLSEQFSADLYSIPFGVNPATLAEGVLVIGAASAATAILIRSRSDRLDLVQALKTRE
jgi:putative ABC transport system permease protein